MLPDVGSTIVPPGRSAPDASAASTIRSAIRSFTEPPGLKYSTLASTWAWLSLGYPTEPDERRVAKQLDEGVVYLHVTHLAPRQLKVSHLATHPGQQGRAGWGLVK